MGSRRRHGGPSVGGAFFLAAVLALVTGRVPAAGAAAPGAREASGVTYRVVGAETLALDAYLPVEVGPHPAVVLLHGGGWSRGSRAEMAGLGRWFAARDVVAFAIDYRLAPRHPYPAAVEDSQAAVRWVRAHASSYGVDPARISAFGLSAGGYLAAMLATLGDGALHAGDRIRVAVAWSAPLDLTQMVASSGAATRSMAEGFVGCRDCGSRLRDASPAAHVDPTDAALFLVNSTREAQPIGGAERLERILARAGVPSRLVRLPGSRHAGGYASAVVQTGGDTVLEASLRYMSIWFDQPRIAAGPVPVLPGDPVAPEAVGVVVLALVVAAVVHVAGRRSRRSWLDPAAMALLDTLGAAGASPSEIEATMGLRAPPRSSETHPI